MDLFIGCFYYMTLDMTLVEVPNVLIIIYVSGTYDYLYIHESYVNLVWYLYLFLLNKLCLSLSLSLLSSPEKMICSIEFWIKFSKWKFNLQA